MAKIQCKTGVKKTCVNSVSGKELIVVCLYEMLLRAGRG